MWAFGSYSLVGKSHIEQEFPNQDRNIAFAKDGCVVCVISDGAGSSRFGSNGAEAIIQNIQKKIETLDSELFDGFDCTIRDSLPQFSTIFSSAVRIPEA